MCHLPATDQGIMTVQQDVHCFGYSPTSMLRWMQYWDGPPPVPGEGLEKAAGNKGIGEQHGHLHDCQWMFRFSNSRLPQLPEMAADVPQYFLPTASRM